MIVVTTTVVVVVMIMMITVIDITNMRKYIKIKKYKTINKL